MRAANKEPNLSTKYCMLKCPASHLAIRFLCTPYALDGYKYVRLVGSSLALLEVSDIYHRTGTPKQRPNSIVSTVRRGMRLYNHPLPASDKTLLVCRMFSDAPMPIASFRGLNSCIREVA